MVIDCDPGVDDALALAMALVSPEIEILAVTAVQGNVPARWARRNARRALTFFGAHLEGPPSLPPVHSGASFPLLRRRVDRRVSAAIHGRDGLGDMFSGGRRPPALSPAPKEPADRLIASLARRMGGDLTLVALGPLTNLALAVRRAPRAMARVGRIVVMGGAARMPGNAAPAAEFNIHCDPHAADLVLGCGAPITLVGLDVTRQTILPAKALRGGGAFRRALRDLTRPYAAFSKANRGEDGIILHDPLALAAAIDPSLVRCETRPVQVECGDGPARGMTVVDLRPEAGLREGGAGGMVDVALEVEAERFLAFFLERMGRYRGW